MAIEDLPGTADFLTNAAHLLRVTAPETSAHLISHRNQLLYEHKASPSDIQRQRVCGGCGTIHLPPIDSKTIKHEPGKTLRQRKSTSAKGSRSGSSTPGAKPPATAESYRLIRCGRCERETKIAIPSPGSAVRHRAKVPAKVKKPTAEALKPTTNATSKKRAKNRKAGLQALLSGQQKQASNPLSLANFMK